MESIQYHRNFVLPKFIVEKFHLKECVDEEKPFYIDKTKISLKDIEGKLLDVRDLEHLRNVLLYFRAAGQVCLQLLGRHITIEREYENKYKVKEEELKKKYEKEKHDVAIDSQSFSHLNFPLEQLMRPKKAFRNIRVQDLIGTAMFPPMPCTFIPAGPNGPDFKHSNFTLRYGISTSLLPKKKIKSYLVQVYRAEDIKYENRFYKSLLEHRESRSWKKVYKPLSNLFVNKPSKANSEPVASNETPKKKRSKKQTTSKAASDTMTSSSQRESKAIIKIH